MKSILYIGLFAGILGLGACTQKQAPNMAEEQHVNEDVVDLTDVQAKNINLEIGQVEYKNISKHLKLNGKIDVPPQNLVSVSIPLGGYLKSTKMLPGTHVNKGQIIAVMEDPQYIQLQQDYLSVRSKLNYAAKELQRQKELNVDKANSDKILQQAETEYRNLNIERRALAEKLKLININADKLDENSLSRTINIYSPIDGYISEVNVNIGKYVTPSDVIFELVNPTDIHLNLTVFERDLDLVQIGQKAIAYTNSKPNQKYEAEVILVSHNVGGNRSAEIHCHFEKYDKSLVPGMYMNAEIELRNQKTATLPEAAIVSFENKDYVFVEIAKNKFKLTPVTVGETEQGYTTVDKNLAGKNIVTKGAYSVLMKMKNNESEEH
ncbi:efflux RND transporter periplasmic adaptor subunit [Pedobacter montanisoli]|uniref:Efflux RND transporter periplasmic adaptor subunit n=1 Tax=Pedobacter montanisoli TaxID=2923277 RepID=A0ABS9ZXE8_9SPHI|nr:efflux RND transporter periplasmic adaptor subunit [Pedobacter montanisoli]MCJ0742972.1 efflux RND transporter periplasmic adaptor subunit [Pedobacter montanisoli]